MREVILNSYREAIRDRVLLVVLAFGVAMIFSSLIIGPLTLGEEIRLAKDIGLGSILFFGLLIILFIGNRVLYRELNEKTCYLILTRPITRFQFIAGKAIGLFLTILVTSLILGIIFISYISLLTGSLQITAFLAVIGVIFQLTMLVGIVILAATFLNPFLGSLFTIFVYIFGQMIPRAILLAKFYKHLAIARILSIFHYIFPDLTYLDFRELLIYNNPIPLERILFGFSYAICYSLVMVLVAGLIFERKDL
ncbi:hypothetical protein DRP53_10380 [candidate division WOR-3 bacterium]|uniref:ABC transporter permease n=1 Tax=candidate division WOR-3 bacterium TaxID=2052148 RepID=A0A660SCS4_UNCW3|nr:MAG: hypothetical protein DRP53_10380 [candidate division WOR-3 bacterium]